MFKIITSIIMAIFILAAPAGLIPSYAMGASIDWKVTGLGKPTSGPVVAPNGLLYYFSSNKLTVLDSSGKKILDMKIPSGATNTEPVFDSSGSVFITGRNSVQEIRPNGSLGWNISITEGKSQSTSGPLLSSGPGSQLYLALPTSLYALDRSGHFKWNILWDNQEARCPMVDTGREILTCAGSNEYLYVVYGERNVNYTLAAINAEGQFAWRYSLGDIKGAGLEIDPDGDLYVTVNPAKADQSNKNRLIFFQSGSSGSPAWSYTTQYNALNVPAFFGKGQAYFCASDYLFAVSEPDGKEIWRQKFYLEKTGPFVDQARDQIYMGTSDKRLLAVDSKGRLKWDMDLDGNVTVQPLIAAGGKIYVATDNGDLYQITDTSPEGN